MPGRGMQKKRIVVLMELDTDVSLSDMRRAKWVCLDGKGNTLAKEYTGWLPITWIEAKSAPKPKGKP